MNCFVKIHDPANVPAASMAPGTKERELLKAELEFQKKNPIVIPACYLAGLSRIFAFLQTLL